MERFLLLLVVIVIVIVTVVVLILVPFVVIGIANRHLLAVLVGVRRGALDPMLFT